MLEPRTHEEWQWTALKALVALWTVAYLASQLCAAGVGGCS